MASTVTLQYLRDQSRAAADQQESGFVRPAELDDLINSACQELYDILVSRFEDYYLEDPVSFSISSPADTVTLPANFYKLRGVDLQNAGGQWAPLKPFMFEERNLLQNPIIYTPTGLAQGMYRVRKNLLQILGTGDNPIQGRLWYIPAFTRLVNAADTFDGVNGWERYVVVTVAIAMKSKEESDTTTLEAEKARLFDRINNLANNRDEGNPQRVQDVTAPLGWGPYPRF
jgi:hypothetical protein